MNDQQILNMPCPDNKCQAEKMSFKEKTEVAIQRIDDCLNKKLSRSTVFGVLSVIVIISLYAITAFSSVRDRSIVNETKISNVEEKLGEMKKDMNKGFDRIVDAINGKGH